MPGFLLGNLILGLVLCFADADSAEFILLITSRRALMYVFGLMLLATSLARRTPIYVRIPAFLTGALMLASLVPHMNIGSLDFGWIVRLAFATSFLAVVFGTLRLCGFQIVNLTDGVSNLEFDKYTGHDLDEWIAVLDDANAASLKHAEIMAFLRQYGFDFSWQKTITFAYERALGRYSMGLTAEGEIGVVVPGMPSTFSEWLTQLRPQRYTIWQLMLSTFWAASLLGFVRLFGPFRPTMEDYRYGIPMTIGISIIALPMLLGCLGVRNVRRKLAISSLVALGTAIGVLYAMGIYSNHWAYLYLFATELVFAGLLMASLMLVRNQGYRIVRVHPRPS